MRLQATQPTLKGVFRKQALKWSAIGFAMTSLLAIFSLGYISMKASEKQIVVRAKSATSAYRNMILDNGTRIAQPQMAEALDLKMGETVVVLDEKFQQIYSDNGLAFKTNCRPEVGICWSKNLSFVEYLEPVYFDEKKESLMGYVDLRIKPTIDWGILTALLALILLAYTIQAFGLSSALNGAAQSISVQLDLWTGYLRSGAFLYSYKDKKEDGLSALQKSSADLNFEIENIKQVAADKAKAAAQMSILKELGHDLKTPISQLDKFFDVLNSKVSAGQEIDTELLNCINQTLTRMRDIANQTGILIYSVDSETSQCDIRSEAKRIVQEFGHLEEVYQKNIKFSMAGDGLPLPLAQIPPGAFYRIMENLITNAVHAVKDDGKVQIIFKNENDIPSITVRDNGCGIKQEIKSRIFDYDFTTKPTRGTGMGLGNVKKLCTLFEAELSFTSEVNEGAEFTVRFQPRLRSKVV